MNYNREPNRQTYIKQATSQHFHITEQNMHIFIYKNYIVQIL